MVRVEIGEFPLQEEWAENHWICSAIFASSFYYLHVRQPATVGKQMSCSKISLSGNNSISWSEAWQMLTVCKNVILPFNSKIKKQLIKNKINNNKRIQEKVEHDTDNLTNIYYSFHYLRQSISMRNCLIPYAADVESSVDTELREELDVLCWKK